MYHFRFYFWINFIIIFISCISCDEETILKNKFVISMESAINKKQYDILKLSNYVETLEYVPLETSLESLFPNVSDFIKGNIYFNDGLFIFPFVNNILKFDRNGSFLGKIGNYGEGPKDYLGVWSIDVDENNDCIYVMSQSKSIKKYSINGNYRGNTLLKIDSLQGHFYRRFQAISENMYIFDLAHQKTPTYMIAFCDTNSNVLKLEKDIQPGINKSGYGGYYDAEMYHFGGKIRFYKPISDTIYSVDMSMRVEPEFVFYYGDYKRPLDENRHVLDYRLAQYVSLNLLLESSQYLFMQFQFGALTPEPFNENLMTRSGNMVEVSIHDVMTIFNKTTGKVNLLKQPQKGDLGFLNDLEDGGPAFWPTFMSRDGTEMVMLYEAEEFIDKYSKVKNPSAKLKKVLREIKFDSNPVAIIAKLK